MECLFIFIVFTAKTIWLFYPQDGYTLATDELKKPW